MDTSDVSIYLLAAAEALNVIRNQIIGIISSPSPGFKILDVTLVGLLGTL